MHSIATEYYLPKFLGKNWMDDKVETVSTVLSYKTYWLSDRALKRLVLLVEHDSLIKQIKKKTLNGFNTQFLEFLVMRTIWIHANRIIGSSGFTALSKNTRLSFNKSILYCAILILLFTLFFSLQSTCSYIRSGKD